MDSKKMSSKESCDCFGWVENYGTVKIHEWVYCPWCSGKLGEIDMKIVKTWWDKSMGSGGMGCPICTYMETNKIYDLMSAIGRLLKFKE